MEIQKQPTTLSKSSKIAVLIAATLSVVFIVIAALVVQHKTVGFDTSALQAINSQSTTPLDGAMIVIAHAGDIATILVLSLIACGLLYKKRNITAVATVMAAVGGAIALNATLKVIFQRDRPELWDLLVFESTFSFPSGHALITSAFIVTIICITWRTKLRFVALTLGILYVFFVGFSRLYLGVHYPTDVLAGWCVGIAWALVVYVAVRFVYARQSIRLTKP